MAARRRRGPHVHFARTSDRPAVCASKVDPLKEWRDYFADGRKFTLGTPWRDAPPQFKRTPVSAGGNWIVRIHEPQSQARGLMRHCEHETSIFPGRLESDGLPSLRLIQLVA